jgi:hypothetical protein
MTIDLIVNSLKRNDKIKNILFAEEIKRNKKYKIIDLNEYLELANLSFILTLFKENYSVSNHINIKSNEYKKIIKLMREFSVNLMGLSLEKLLNKVVHDLKEELENLLKNRQSVLLFENEIKDIINILENIYTPKSNEYKTYYYVAKDVASDEKGYLAVAISLIFEGISFYLHSNLRDFSPKLEVFFKTLEQNKNSSNFTDYDILDLCRNVFNFSKEKFKPSNKIKNYVTIEIKNELYKAKFYILKKYGYFSDIRNHPLIRLLNNSRTIRNNLLHANSSVPIDNIKEKVNSLLDDYKKLIIEDVK